MEYLYNLLYDFLDIKYTQETLILYFIILSAVINVYSQTNLFFSLFILFSDFYFFTVCAEVKLVHVHLHY